MERTYFLLILAVSLVFACTRSRAGIAEASTTIAENPPEFVPTGVTGSEPKKDDAVGKVIKHHDAKEMVVSEPAKRPAHDPGSMEVAYVENQPSPSHIDAALARPANKNFIRISPFLGRLSFEGPWANHVNNRFSTGLLMDYILTSSTSIEIEGSYAKSHVTYDSFSHPFSQYGVGGYFRVNLADTEIVQPYMSAGIGWNYFEGMSHGPRYLFVPRYNDWLISGGLNVGMNFRVTRKTALGIRGSYAASLLHRPDLIESGLRATPYYEEASLMNTSFYRLMALVQVSL
jgi:hypothetical protein